MVWKETETGFSRRKASRLRCGVKKGLWIWSKRWARTGLGALTGMGIGRAD